MADVKIYTATKTDEVIAQAINNKGLNSVVKDVAVTEDGTGIKVVRSNGTETVVNFPAGGSVGSGLTQADIDSAIDALNLEQYALKSDIPDPQDLSEYALKSDIPSPQDLSSVVQTDDPRLVDARTPIDHTHTASDITDFPAIPDISGLATKEEVDSLVYLTGEVARQVEVTPAIFSITIEARYGGDAFRYTHEFSPTGGEVPEGYDVVRWYPLSQDLSSNDFVIQVTIRESGSETYKEIRYSPQEGEMTDVTGTLEAYEPPAPSIARLIHEWLYGILADIISRSAENELYIIIRGNGFMPAVVKDVYLKSDGSYGPVSKVVEGIEVERLSYGSNTTLTTQFSDGESHVQNIPSINITTPFSLGHPARLKSHPLTVVNYPDMSEVDIEIDRSIGSVVYGHLLGSSERAKLLAVESVPTSLVGVAEEVSSVITVVPLPLQVTSSNGGQRLEMDVEAAPVVDLNRISVPLIDPYRSSETQQLAVFEFTEQVISAEWVDPPQGHLFAVVPGLTHIGSVAVDGVLKTLSGDRYPGIVPLNSNGGGLEQGGSAGPFTSDALGELHLPARSYVEIDVSTATATVKFPAIASSGLMMTACVIGPPENLSFPEGTVNIGQPSPVGGLSFATLLKRASSDWYVIWTQLPATEGV